MTESMKLPDDLVGLSKFKIGFYVSSIQCCNLHGDFVTKFSYQIKHAILRQEN